MKSVASLFVVIALLYPTESGLFGKKKSFIPPSVEWNIGGDPDKKDNGLGIYVEENPPRPRFELIFGDDIYLQKESKSGYFVKAWQKYEYVAAFTQQPTKTEEEDEEASEYHDGNELDLYIVLKRGRKLYSLPATDLEAKLNDGSAQIKVAITKKFTKENHPEKPLPEWLTRVGDGKKMDQPPYFQGKWRGKIMKNKFDTDLDGPLSVSDSLKPLDAERSKKFKKYTPKLFKNRKVSLDRAQEGDGHILYKYSVKPQYLDMLYDDDEEEENESILGPLSVITSVFAAMLCGVLSLCLGVVSGFIAAVFMARFKGKSKQPEDGYTVAEDVASNI